MKAKNGDIIEIPNIDDRRGKLCFLENNLSIPFRIKRIYYIFDVPSETNRGGHAHKNLCQLFIPLSGSFSITLKWGKQSKEYQLNNPKKGLYIGPMVWRELYNFSSGAVCLVLASEKYSEKDYIRNYKVFKKHEG
jgi:dTDP-4-dehydrorhamnose 3,5-epimerase-like enzyme